MLVLLLLLLVSGLALAEPAVAAGAGDFADNQPLVVDLGTAPESVDVHIVNTARVAMQFTLGVVGPAAKYLMPVTPNLTIEPGMRAVSLRVAGAGVAIQGTLVLVGPDGTLARRVVRLVGSSAGRDLAALVPGSFDSLAVRCTSWVPSMFRPLPSARTWGLALIVVLVLAAGTALGYWRTRGGNAAVSTVFGVATLVALVASLVLFSGWTSAFIDDRRHHTRVATTAWTVASANHAYVVGTLTSDNGDTGTLTLDGARLTVTGLAQSGSYSGTVDTRPTSDGGEVKVLVKVRDWWLYALLTITAGVLVGWLMSLFYATRQPAEQLKADLAELNRRVAGLDSGWALETVGREWGPLYRLAAYVQSQSAALQRTARTDAAAAEESVTKFNALVTKANSMRFRIHDLGRRAEEIRDAFLVVVPDLAGRPRWLDPLFDPFGLEGQDLDVADEVVQTRLEAVKAAEAAAGPAARATKHAIDLWIAGLPDEKQQSWRSQAKELIRASNATVVQSVAEKLDKLEEGLTKPNLAAVQHAGALPRDDLERARQQAVSATQSRPPLSAPTAAAPAADRDNLVSISCTVTPQPGDGALKWHFRDGSVSRPFTLQVGQPSTQTIEHQFTSTERRVDATLVAEGGRVLAEWSGTLSPTGRAARLRAALASDQRAVAVVAALLAVGSGMVALYLPNATWGSAGNYVTALLWGSATAEGIKAVVNIASNRLPTL